MKRLFIILLFLCTSRLLPQAVINELMPAPSADEPEWIEMFNSGDTDIVYRNVYFSNQNSSKKIAYFRVPAHSFAVLTSDTVQLLSKRRLPARSLIFKATLPTLHNTFDPFVFRNSDSSVIDSVYYDMKWGRKGISLERRDPLMAADNPQNLSASVSQDSATMGYENSTAIKDNDVFISAERKTDSIAVIICNSGRNKLNDLILRIYADSDNNNFYDSNEQFLLENIRTLPRGDTAIYVFSSEKLKETAKIPGWYHCSAKVEVNNPEIIKTTLFEAFLSPDFGSLKINEFLFDESDSAGYEFIEIINCLPLGMEMKGFCVSNSHSKQGFDSIFVTKSVILPAGEYFTFVWDTNFYNVFPELRDNELSFCQISNMNLKKAGDAVYLTDPNGKVTDSLTYDDTWVTKDAEKIKNISLEKIKPSLISNLSANWLSCGDAKGATPNRSNSVSVSLKSSVELKAEPNPFSPLDAGARQQTTISFKLPFPASRISCHVFTSEGLPLRELENNRYTSPEGIIDWDGNDDRGQKAARGQYIILLEAVNVSDGETINGKTVIVVGR